ncbi:hypothetical protein [Streptomyces sp. NPDC017673]|uniref:hypothetical protein n=1 Tax=unclassified Streptomyces TaxID=2593676 RepID=UPI00378BF931
MDTDLREHRRSPVRDSRAVASAIDDLDGAVSVFLRARPSLINVACRTSAT